MADTTTPVYSFVLPEVDGSDGTWGTKLNANLTALDGLLSGSTNLQNASFTGTVSFGGSTGTAGQVLKSQGAGANAIWTDDTDTTYTAGSGLSLTGTEFANTAPDQTVTLTGSGATSVSGTYPSFTIASTNTTYSVGDGGLTEINFTSADNTKLDGIESGATADQTAAEIKTAYESNADTNAFTDSDSTKLSGIEASADVTDTANVTAAGAVMDSELTSEASVKALNQGVATTDSPSFVNLTLSGTGSVKVPSGTTAQRDGSPANGMFRYNSTNEQFEGYQSGDWGAIGGGGGSNTFTADTFTGDGSTTAYALSQVINSEDNLLVFIAGVFQQQSAYSIATASGTTTLTFATAPANTREIIVYSVASAVSGSNLNIDSMTGDGSDTTLSLSINPVNENNTQVFIDGVYQNKDTYSISGTTLTFSTAPPTGSAVEVMTMTQTEINVPVDGTITPAKIASGDFYFDTNTLYVDSTNNRVGVGTSVPVSKLDAVLGSTSRILLRERSSRAYIDSVTETNSAFDSLGINGSEILFETNGSERARIDSSGNLLVGTTTTLGASNLTSGETGFVSRSNGLTIASRSSGTALLVNRATSDGDITVFQKNGSTVGSIGVGNSNDLTIGTADTGLVFQDNERISPWNPSTNSLRDAAIDFGDSDRRFKDLYLSGGVYSGTTQELYPLSSNRAVSSNFLVTGSTKTKIATLSRVGGAVAVRIAWTGGNAGSSTGSTVYWETEGAFIYGQITGTAYDHTVVTSVNPVFTYHHRTVAEPVIQIDSDQSLSGTYGNFSLYITLPSTIYLHNVVVTQKQLS